jgi:hypothetical protein
MAIVTTSGLISHIKGSMGGSTFQSSASGLTMRKKPIPVGRGTNAQLQQRNIIGQLNFAWSNLTDQQRAVWGNFANFCNGVGKTNKQNRSANTGKTQFVAVNSWLLQYGKPILTAPTFVLPPAQCIPCPPFYTVSLNLGETTYNLDTTQEILVTQVSLAQGAGTVSANTGFRTLIYTQVDGTTQDWSLAFLAMYGVPLVLGSKYWIQYTVVNFVKGTISPKSRALVLYDSTPSLGIGGMVIGSTFIVG